MSARSMRSTSAPDESYWIESRRPLVVLVFLLPLIVAYELGIAFVLREDDHINTNTAHKSLLEFFEIVGVAPTGGLYLGGLAIIAVLFAWHMLNRDPWRFRLGTIGLMLVESLVLTLPVLVLSRLVSQELAASAATLSSPSIESLPLWPQLMISIGAGVYEELLFRMLAIAVLHTLLVDVAKLDELKGAVIAILVSAALFTWYHPLTGGAGEL
ncbi:MAG: CPBP family intramembrane metalloprotease, partial [Phycisphaerales bacterium]|nr:CPBP family intramembrane metalloprotease [Phycisphaerales bacterium]